MHDCLVLGRHFYDAADKFTIVAYNFYSQLKVGSYNDYNFYSNSLIFWGAVLSTSYFTSYFFLNIMHGVETQISGELFVKKMLTVFLIYYMVLSKKYKIKKKLL